MLRRARHSVKFGLAQSVLAVGVCAWSTSLEHLQRLADNVAFQILDVAAGFLISSDLEGPFWLLACDIFEKEHPWSGIERRYVFDDSSLADLFKIGDATRGTCLSAVGAVVCAVAIERERFQTKARQPFVVCYRKGCRTGAVLLGHT